VLHPLNNYQLGSVRDDFDMGVVQSYTSTIINDFLTTIEGQEGEYGGLYALRLFAASLGDAMRIPEPLYTLAQVDGAEDVHFKYLEENQQQVQKHSCQL